MKMKVNVILGHPNNESFNYAIAQKAIETLKKNGHDVVFHDLYAENFNPLLLAEDFVTKDEIKAEIKQYCEEIAEADGIIIVHPNWWGQPPAILKGWVDKVIRQGVAYEFLEGDSGEGIPNGLLKASSALVFNTSNTIKEREINEFGDPLENLWKKCIFGLCGVHDVYRKMFRVIVTSTLEQRHIWLDKVQNMVNSYFPA